MTAIRPQFLQVLAACGVAFGLLAATAQAARKTSTHPTTAPVVLNPTPVLISAP